MFSNTSTIYAPALKNARLRQALMDAEKQISALKSSEMAFRLTSPTQEAGKISQFPV